MIPQPASGWRVSLLWNKSTDNGYYIVNISSSGEYGIEIIGIGIKTKSGPWTFFEWVIFN